MLGEGWPIDSNLPATICPVCRVMHYEITLFCRLCDRARRQELEIEIRRRARQSGADEDRAVEELLAS